MAEKTEKPVNYTPEQTAELVQAYVANPTAETVATFAEKLGKNVRSVIQKLVREGVYQKKEYVTKRGEKPQKKDETASAIGAVLKLSEADVDSLTKANKSALQKIFQIINIPPITKITSTCVVCQDARNLCN